MHEALPHNLYHHQPKFKKGGNRVGDTGEYERGKFGGEGYESSEELVRGGLVYHLRTRYINRLRAWL